MVLILSFKIKAKTLVECMSYIIMKKVPEFFEQSIFEWSRKLCWKKVTIPYKIQRTIDTQPTGGLNLGCIKSLRKGVEELQKRKQGFFPSSTTVARAARKLEGHVIDEYGFSIDKITMPHGPVYLFDIHNII
jgi:hypothetical protein